MSIRMVCRMFYRLQKMLLRLLRVVEEGAEVIVGAGVRGPQPGKNETINHRDLLFAVCVLSG